MIPGLKGSCQTCVISLELGQTLIVCYEFISTDRLIGGRASTTQPFVYQEFKSNGEPSSFTPHLQTSRLSSSRGLALDPDPPTKAAPAGHLQMFLQWMEQQSLLTQPPPGFAMLTTCSQKTRASAPIVLKKLSRFYCRKKET